MALVIDSLSKCYGAVQALDGISFVAQAGQVFGFLGPNGAGKTTTMRIVLDIIHADAGSVTWAGRPAGDAPRRTWGYLPEERGLYPRMKVLDQLVFVAALHGRRRAARRHGGRATGWPASGSREYAERRAEQLSKGNQQKVQFIASHPPRPRRPAHGRAVLGAGPDQRGVAQGGVPRAARSGQGDRLQHPPDGGGRGAVRRDRDHRSRPAGPSRARFRASSVRRAGSSSASASPAIRISTGSRRCRTRRAPRRARLPRDPAAATKLTRRRSSARPWRATRT